MGRIKEILLFLCVIGIFQCFPAAGQNAKLDSIQKVLKKTQEDTTKVNLMNNLAWGYLYSKPDTALYFINQTLLLADKIFVQDEIKDVKKINAAKKGKANALRIKGYYHFDLGNYKDALACYAASIRLSEEINDKKGIAMTYGNIGNVYNYQSDYPKALEYYYKALHIAEETGMKKEIARHLGNIGIVYSDQMKYPKALEYYFKALKMAEELGLKQLQANTLGNIGNVYFNQSDFSKALEYYFSGLTIDENLGNQYGIANTLGNIGNAYNNQKNYVKAKEYYYKALDIKEQVGDKNGIATTLGDIGTLCIKTKNFDEASKHLARSIAISDSIGALNWKQNAEKSFTELDSTRGNFKGAFEHYKKYISTRDSIFNEESKKKQLHVEMNYEFEKKTAIMKVEQEKKNAEARAEKKRIQLIMILLLAFAVSIGIIAFIILRSLRITRRQKNIIENAHEEISLQKKIVEEKNKDITDSINYAARIQRALLTSDSFIQSHVPSYFIYFKPKDIVSGDFYWANKVGDAFYLMAADCTGHGVPGAFMSLLNISFLNEIVLEHKLDDPAAILNVQREKIIHALNPQGVEGEHKDGMDCILLRLDALNPTSNQGEMQLTYAAANNAPLLIRDGAIIELPCDKMPVGMYMGEQKPFVSHTVPLQKGDMVYAYTDGFADQFGGPKGKKFKYKALNDMLLSVAQLPMEDQKSALEAAFEQWKGNLEQVDDVLVIGWKVV